MAEKPDPKHLKEAEKFVKLMKAKATKAILSQCKRWRQDLASIEASWNSLDKTRNDSPFVMGALEFAGRANFPPKSDFKRCEHWIYNVENGVAKNYNTKLPQWMKNAEFSIKSLEAKIKSYISRIDGGGDIAVGTLVLAKGAGMVAVGVLAAAFAGPAIASTVASELGVAAVGMLTGSTASVISTNVEIVATTFGRSLTGEKLDVKKELRKTLDANMDAAVTGMVLGAWGAKINLNVTSKIFKRLPIKRFTPEAAQHVTRLGVGGFNKFVRAWLKSDGKSEVPAASKKMKSKMSHKMNEDAMMLLVLEEASKSPKFRAALADYAKKNAGKK